MGGDDEQWVDNGDAEENAFAETLLEDPAKALAEARGEAAALSAESTEHSNPAGRAQPYVPPAGAELPPPPMSTPAVPPVGPPADLAGGMPGAMPGTMPGTTPEAPPEPPAPR